MSEGERCVVMTTRTYRDRNDTLIEFLKDRREQEHLMTILEQRLQKLKSLQECEDELLEEAKKAKELIWNFDISPKEQDADQNIKKAEKERKEVHKKEVDLEMLKEEYAQLQHRKQELLHHMHRDAMYRDFMQQVFKLTRFEDEASLAGHLENLLRIREQLCEKRRLAEEQVDLQRKALLTFNSQHRLMLLQRSNQLAQLHHKLDRAQPEVERWETKWKHIQGTAAKKTLLLGLIKMAALNLYEVTGGHVDGEKGVHLGDTDTQLDKIKMFIQDHKDIVKQHQSSAQRHDEEKINVP
ncbi:coiled-coil domain-containing protein 42 like-2 isoform X1 [Syngnathus acus]|uniref:coiled-coil domain-containing protein 42 like-2 isoform X1 n=2 Tax=Syngnathus acus TaxID=161584 RepID=UPI0018864827|nr:coiled-coil domain-containing protein 42 like-2 isoform X1 [Syngnathus acus]